MDWLPATLYKIGGILAISVRQMLHRPIPCAHDLPASASVLPPLGLETLGELL